MLDSTNIFYPGPRFSEPISLYHDRSNRVYTGLLALRPTAFNRVGMGSRGLGGRYRDRGGSLNGDGTNE